MSFELRRDVVAGSLAGLVGGLVLGWAGITSDVDGLLDLDLSGAGFGLNLLVSIVAGAIFGSLFRYQPGGYAALISNGLLYALLLWVAGPLTLTPLLMGDGPTWSVGAAQVAFSTLIGHLLYGGLTGFGFYVRGYVNRCVNDIRRRPSQPLIQWRFHPHTAHRDRRLRSTQGPSDA